MPRTQSARSSTCDVAADFDDDLDDDELDDLHRRGVMPQPPGTRDFVAAGPTVVLVVGGVPATTLGVCAAAPMSSLPLATRRRACRCAAR